MGFWKTLGGFLLVKTALDVAADASDLAVERQEGTIRDSKGRVVVIDGQAVEDWIEDTKKKAPLVDPKRIEEMSQWSKAQWDEYRKAQTQIQKKQKKIKEEAEELEFQTDPEKALDNWEDWMDLAWMAYSLRKGGLEKETKDGVGFTRTFIKFSDQIKEHPEKYLSLNEWKGVVLARDFKNDLLKPPTDVEAQRRIQEFMDGWKKMVKDNNWDTLFTLPEPKF